MISVYCVVVDIIVLVVDILSFRQIISFFG